MLTKIEEERIVTQVMQRLATLLHESFSHDPLEEPEFLTPEMVKKNFSIESATVRSWVRNGIVEGCPGKPFLVKTRSLRKYITEKCQ